MAIERGDIIGVILGKIMKIRISRNGPVQSPDFSTDRISSTDRIYPYSIFSISFDNRDRLGIGAVSEIFFPKKETFKENE